MQISAGVKRQIKEAVESVGKFPVPLLIALPF